MRGVDDSAQLKQVMPIAAVAGEAGCVEAKHGTDLAEAQSLATSFRKPGRATVPLSRIDRDRRQ